MKFSSYQPAVVPNVMRPPAVQASGDVNAYGDVKAGAGLGQLAGAIGQVTAVLAKRQDDMDAASVMEARQKIMTSVTEQLYGQGGLFQTAQGENAKGLTERTTDTIKKTFDDVAKNYNGRVQYALKGNLNENMANFQRIAASREMQEYESTQKADYESNITNNAQLAGLTYNVKDALQNYVNDALRLTDARGAQQGWTGAQLQTERMKGITSIVASAVGAAIDNEDYDTAGAYLARYRKDMDQATYAKFAKVLKKRDEARQIDMDTEEAFKNPLIWDGTHFNEEEARKYVDSMYGPNATKTVAGGEGVLWDIARKTSALTGIKPEFIYAQLYHESGGGNSQLARENLNFAGLTQVEPNGEENKQPDGGNYYRVFKNADEFAEAYAHDFLNRYEGIKDAQTVEEYATILRNNGYFTAPLENYIAGLKGALASSEGSHTVSAYDPEKRDQLFRQLKARGAEMERGVKEQREAYLENVARAMQSAGNYSGALSILNGQDLTMSERNSLQGQAKSYYHVKDTAGGGMSRAQQESGMKTMDKMMLALSTDGTIRDDTLVNAQYAFRSLLEADALPPEVVADYHNAIGNEDLMSDVTSNLKTMKTGGAYKYLLYHGVHPLAAAGILTMLPAGYWNKENQGQPNGADILKQYHIR